MKKTIHICQVLLMIAFLFSGLNAMQAATITWNGNGGDGLWSTSSNWDTNTLPTQADNVLIPATFTVTLSSDAGYINKITVSGKLVITATGALNVNQTVASSPIFDVSGGEVENAGTLTIKQTLANNTTVVLQFSDNATRDDKFTTTGVLNIDNVAATNSSTTGRTVSFTQTSTGRTAHFVMGGTMNMNIKTSMRFIELLGGNAELDGTATIGSSSDYKNWRFIHMNLVGGTSNTLTIAPTADITFYSGFDSTNGCININTVNAGSSTFYNKGKLTIHGGGSFSSNTPYGISINPQATGTTATTATFTNEGTLTVDGNFPGGAIFLTGGAFSGSLPVFNNQAGATLTVSNSSSSTNAAPLRATTSGVTTIVFNNAGTVGFNSSISYSTLFGNSNSVFNNSGAVTVNKALSGYLANSSACVFNNNTSGLFNFNMTLPTDSAITKKNKNTFVNSGGKVSGNGIFGAGTFVPSTGVLSPGGDAGVGIMTFADANFNLTGKCLMNINGTVTAGTDYDQLVFAGNADISGASLELQVGYAPSSSDAVSVITTATRTGNFSSITAPTKWTAVYTSTTANAFYDTSTGIDQPLDKESIKVVAGQVLVKNVEGKLCIVKLTDLSGKTIRQVQSSSTGIVLDAPSCAGIYLIHVQLGDKKLIQKVIF